MNKVSMTIKDQVLILNFKGNKTLMNQMLDCLSNVYEGSLKNREGHNFPADYITKDHFLWKYKQQCRYVVAVYNTRSLSHELLHAKYFVDNNYRLKINREWANLIPQRQAHITNFLRKLGYSDKVIIDEYQAYRYTEKPNFFG